ncbi:MAG: hypothetical protein KF850_34585 [Labilithrix sp.]|nr:hypothetical protein [Labilithrix sp.]MBX3217209.1 hypothetical protein [Labilithrix sp.]
MLGSRFTLGCAGALVIAFGLTWACIPHPEADFEDFQERAAAMPKVEIEASTFEAAPPPTEAVEGVYYGACLAELAFGSPSRRFNFYTVTKYTPDPSGAKLELSIQPLKVVNNQPPPTITKDDATGPVIAAPVAEVAPSGRFLIELGTTNVPGNANPISGGDVEILRATLDGRFAEARFCARLGGEVTKPAAAARQLDPPQNICQFVPIKDGDPMPEFTAADFQPESCPLD